MTNYSENINESEENGVCDCIVCSLTEEFTDLIQSGVRYESALRHILGVAVSVNDELLAEAIDEAYRDGMVDALRNIADMTIDIADEMEGMAPESEAIEDLTDEEFVDIQERLLKQIEENS